MSDTILKILMVLEPSGGGSGRHFVDLCAGLQASGHHVEAVYSPKRAEARFVAELKAIGLPAVHAVSMARSPGPSDLAAWRALSGIIRKSGPFDILHAHSSKAGALLRLRTRRTGTARIYTPHAFRTMDPTLGRIGRMLYGGIEGFLGRFASEAIIAVSGDEARHAETLGIKPSNVHVVVNGVGPAPMVHEGDIRAGLSLPADAIVIGSVGRLSAQKAPERLVEAFNRVAGNHPALHLAMIGAGELDDAIGSLIAASPYGDRIRLNASIPGNQAMRAFDILAMTSRYEAMSYVMLEAEAAGLPMVLTDVGGAGEVVEQGINGLIVANSDDVADLASALDRMAATEELSAFRLEAAKRRDRHSLAAMVDATLAVYRDALGQAPKG